jgi:hypothetical protein
MIAAFRTPLDLRCTRGWCGSVPSLSRPSNALDSDEVPC